MQQYSPGTAEVTGFSMFMFVMLGLGMPTEIFGHLSVIVKESLEGLSTWLVGPVMYTAFPVWWASHSSLRPEQNREV